ncbi:hypothetical protein [Novosphingobium cyanobacteriorum]|uniref:Uncharacterized protein n=1 Tax=Novosphingobium cyanobacteriorum TaxID=3024215 RepID=A0ABT6CK23_9SPHN|nr:hypothetical protein [Novosphingobium cyanobacteriorum]MDF8334274.1 hypothetical protein [Novosphingobium cyanobacteriorum]
MQLFRTLNVSTRNHPIHRSNGERLRAMSSALRPVSPGLTRQELQAIVMDMVD